MNVLILYKHAVKIYDTERKLSLTLQISWLWKQLLSPAYKANPFLLILSYLVQRVILYLELIKICEINSLILL